MTICPHGHRSQTDDYCDVCGSPMAEPSEPYTSTPNLSTPLENRIGGLFTSTRDVDDIQLATPPTSYLDEVPSPVSASTPSTQMKSCPLCRTQTNEDAFFCEACGYDFLTGQLPRTLAVRPDETAPAPESESADDHSFEDPNPQSSEDSGFEEHPVDETAQPPADADSPEPYSADRLNGDQPDASLAEADVSGQEDAQPVGDPSERSDSPGESADPSSLLELDPIVHRETVVDLDAVDAAVPGSQPRHLVALDSLDSQPTPDGGESPSQGHSEPGNTVQEVPLLQPTQSEAELNEPAQSEVELREPEQLQPSQPEVDLIKGELVASGLAETEPIEDAHSQPEPAQLAQPKAELAEPAQPEAESTGSGSSQSAATQPTQPQSPQPQPARLVYRPQGVPRSQPAQWVCEVWIDPEWYRIQQAPDPLPSPGQPAILAVRSTTVMIGRNAPQNRPDIICGTDSGVSRQHAKLTFDGSRWFIEDLGSSNGTYIGQVDQALPTEPISHRTELRPHNRVYVGSWTRLVIRPALVQEADL